MTTRHPNAPTARPPSQGMERVAPFVLAAILALGGVLWLTGQLAAWLASGHWPHVSFSEIGRVLVRFPKHPSDPALAWPPAAARLMPGPIGMYLILTVLLAAIAAAGGWIWHLTQTRGGGKERRDNARGAQWATSGDLKGLLAKTPRPGRLTIGKFGRYLVVGEERHSLLVVGPTQTGKTTGLAIPAILEWDGPVVCTSVKNDILNDTIEARRQRNGQVLVFDPLGTSDHSNTWTPLTGCEVYHRADETAGALTSLASPNGIETSESEHFRRAAKKLLTPLLHAAALDGRPKSEVVRWIDTHEEREPLQILGRLPDKHALHALQASFHRETRELGGVYTTTENALEAYQDPRVLASATGADITPDLLLDGGQHTLYACAPVHQQERLASLFVTVLQQVINAAAERYQRNGPLDPPLLIVLDEAANIAPLKSLGALAASAAGQGVQLVTIFQDLAQAQAVYGATRASSILTNHKARLFLGGSADLTTLRHASGLIGETEIDRTSVSFDEDGRRSTTTELHRQALAPPDLLRRLPRNTGVLVYGDHPATRIRLRPWYE